MTITYRSIVLHVPPTPLGLLPERWTIEHWCNLCHQRVAPAQLIPHAQDHQQAETRGLQRALPILRHVGHNGAAPT